MLYIPFHGIGGSAVADNLRHPCSINIAAQLPARPARRRRARNEISELVKFLLPSLNKF
jgi:hypothetical protein